MASRSGRRRRILMTAAMVAVLPATVAFAVFNARLPFMAVPRWWRTVSNADLAPCVSPDGRSFCGPIDERTTEGSRIAARVETGLEKTAGDSASSTGVSGGSVLESRQVLMTPATPREFTSIGARPYGIGATTMPAGTGGGIEGTGAAGGGSRPQAGSPGTIGSVSDAAPPPFSTPLVTSPVTSDPQGVQAAIETGSAPVPPAPAVGPHGGTTTVSEDRAARVVLAQEGTGGPGSAAPGRGTTTAGSGTGTGGGVKPPQFDEHGTTVEDLTGGRDHQGPGIRLGPSGGESMSSTPEPSSILLIGTGLAGLGVYWRRRRGAGDQA
jgi:hypothetical protein